MASNKDLDLVLLGPTGYTGRLCAEHIVQHLPTDLKWALAGRSYEKVEKVANDIKQLNPDRAVPEILTVQINKEELTPLAQRTKLILNCVGPYHLYSTPVVEVCAVNGTHYLDVTGETPWIKSIIDKYHDTAKSNGAIIIPSVGVESAPADILAWSLVKRVREDLSSHTREITSCIEEVKSSGASGGTLSTILTIFDTLSITDLLSAANPFALAASTPPKNLPREPLLSSLLGVRSVRDLGTLTTSPSGLADITIVHRSSTLTPEFYGPRFYFRQFLHVRNTLVAVLFHFGLMLVFSFLLIPFMRTLARKVVYAPGTGPRKEDGANDRLEYRAIATADQGRDVDHPKRVFGKLMFSGNAYTFTGLLLAEAAMVILQNEEKVRKVSRAGIVTPAMLGQDFVDRLEKVGCVVETKVFDN
ncbi:saccharopine dehydrogenase [Aspergillus sclerotialis]|uniref:Saccharopine dehydrogenase n=1 Tax=Aspergillus sclerotialis TaxID=2070753 RepID=A0A3A2ZF29_9EURO|nr:saccharopine dehydrogenase [Aspergillus sclerotialis]